MGKKRDPEGYSLGQEQSAKVAERIRGFIQKSEKSQAAIARESGMEPPHLSAMLKADGSRNVQRWMVVRIAKALGKTERDLVGGIVPDVVIAQTPGPSPTQRPEEPAVTLKEFMDALEARQQRYRQVAGVLIGRHLDQQRLSPEEWKQALDELAGPSEPRRG